MVMTDPIADMLTRIRNALEARHEKVDVPYSKFKEEVLKILKEEGYIKDYKFIKKNPGSILKVELKYDEYGDPVIQGMKKISKPGRRIYARKDKLPKVLNGYGTAIISTSQGLLPDRVAREKGIGGEVICYVW